MIKKKVSVIIPCFNEKDTISIIIDKVQNISINKEIIVICDGSQDGTREILKKLEKEYEDSNFRVIYHECNKGKGASIHSGITKAEGDLVIIQDADLELDPNDYYNLLTPFENGASIVFGTRFKSGYGDIPFYSKIANFCVTFLANVLYGTSLSDEACGYKILPLSVYKELNLECTGFDFCPEVTAKVSRKGYKITEVPVNFKPRNFNEGKKIHWKHGFEAVWKLLKYRFVSI